MAIALVLFVGGCDWSQFMAGPGHTGLNVETAITPSNVGTLVKSFTASAGVQMFESQASIVNGIAYAISDDAHLYAFSASGTSGCAGMPPLCLPLWQAVVGVNGAQNQSGPAVVSGSVFVYGTDGNLYSFDAAGATNCSGVPRICSPLWQAHVDGNPNQSPTVVNGVVYVTSAADGGRLEAFDAAGTTGCTGSPKICSPIWTSTTIGNAAFGAVTVVNGIAYVPDGNIYAFDATGNSCSGVPKVCTPLWQDVPAEPVSGSAAVSGGTLFVDTSGPLIIPPMPKGGLEAFDAKGVSNCSGSPKVCQPLWTSGNYPSWVSPTIGNGLAYVPTFTGGLVAFDAAGNKNCFGAPKICAPVWTASINTINAVGPAVVAGGVLFVVAGVNELYAFDAAGVMNCSATVCSPLWSTSTYIAGQVSVANGIVYLGGASSSTNGALFAYALP